MTPSINIDKQFNNFRVHLVRNSVLYASKGYALYKKFDDVDIWHKIITLKTDSFHRILSKFKLPSRLFRAGIHNIIPLSSGTLLVIAQGKFYRLSENDSKIEIVHRLRYGRRPLLQGCCIDPSDNIYYGEYWMNSQRREVHIYQGINDGREWKIICTFPPHSIRHVHCAQYDPFTGWLWLATGDREKECKIAYSEDGCQTLIEIGAGNELWRTTSLIFTKEYVYWGTDAEYMQNYICRWNRTSATVEKLKAVDGPIYHSKRLNEGTFLFSSGVENAPSEWDNFARIWISFNGLEWKEIAKWRKDRFSPHYFGHGAIYFAEGEARSGLFYFSPVALRYLRARSYCAQINC